MPQMLTRVSVDASVLFAASYSATGTARDLLVAGSEGRVTLLVSDFILLEVQRNLTRRYPDKLPVYETLVKNTPLTVVNPSKEEVLTAAQYTVLKDAPVIAAAIKANTEYLATYDRKHLIDPPEISEKSGLRITTPDRILQAIQEQSNDNNPE
jgi:predicted nucleic acid-binding protein